MLTIRTAPLAILALSAVAFLTLPAAPAQAQTSDDAASAPMSKQSKKAQHKAARAKKNAELNDLEKNGYNPAGEQNTYPSNIQNAQKKVDAQKAGKPAPASTP